MSFAMIWSVFFLDLILGDPQRAPHPVRGIGICIDRMEAWVRSWAQGPKALYFGGCVLTAIIVFGTFAVTWLLVQVFFSMNEWVGTVVAVVLGYTTLAVRDLFKHSWHVVKAVRAEDLPEARKRLSMIVGRDTSDLDAEGIYRAVIETVAENLSDGIVGPLFYMSLGGVPLAMAYKAASTLDSMVGYKNDRYARLGWCSARLDDVLNFIPARLTALMIVAAAFGLRFDASKAWRMFLRDGGNHKSPNAGRPEAAMAGAIGVQLGGPSMYEGALVEKPYIGDAVHPVTDHRVIDAEQVMFIASIFTVAFSSLVCMVL